MMLNLAKDFEELAVWLLENGGTAEAERTHETPQPQRAKSDD
jgi:hypothetical protein